jgi:hypothetical protein
VTFFSFFYGCQRSPKGDSHSNTSGTRAFAQKKEKKKTQPSFSEVFSKQCLEKWRQAVSVFVFSLGETKTLTAFGPACLHLAKARAVFFMGMERVLGSQAGVQRERKDERQKPESPSSSHMPFKKSRVEWRLEDENLSIHLVSNSPQELAFIKG